MLRRGILKRAYNALAATLGVCCATLFMPAAPKGTHRTPASPDSVALAKRGIDLVETGHCEAALPLLKRAMPQIADRQFRYRTAMAEARCAMAIDDRDTAIAALLQLEHEFPEDPEALYVTTHYFSELAMRTSRELALKAPRSYQARRLEAEAYEAQGKWDEAAGIYRGILSEDPSVPGIHYRLGQVLLSKAGDSGSVDEAKNEFQRELQIDPKSAAAEFVLGELARRAGQWDDAAGHFLRATELDVSFTEAYLALGMSLAAESKFADAIQPLEAYVRAQPDDPAGHYQLAIAYSRTNNKEGALREMTLHNELAARRQSDGGPH